MKYLIALFLLSLTACGGCDDTPCDGGCPIGQVCSDDQCQPVACFGGCALGEVCLDGTCQIPPEQCAVVGQTCDPFLPTLPGTFCVDMDGFGTQPPICVEACAADGSCPEGGLCFWLSSSFDDTCLSNSDCATGKECIQGACRDTVCRPSECEGVVAGLQTCQDLYAGTAGFANGAVCAEVGNAASYCFPAGLVELGQPCQGLEAALTNDTFDATCAAGLACVDGVCRTPCTSSTACTGDETCLLADQNALGQGVGFCEETCEPFVAGSCGNGSTCLPIAADQGVCIEAGAKQAFETCTPGLSECVDGTVCAVYQEEEASLGISFQARCQPICNVAIAPAESDGSVTQVAQAQRDATCPNPPPSKAVLVVTYLGSRSAGVDVYLDDVRVAQNVATGTRSTAIQTDAGQAIVRLLPAGAASTDPSYAQPSVSLSAGKLLEIVSSDEALVATTQIVTLRTPSDSASVVEAQDLGAAGVDVIAVSSTGDLAEPADHVEVYTSALSQADLPPGTWNFYAFASGSPRDDAFNALATLSEVVVAADDRLVLYISGTATPDDDVNPQLHLLERLDNPEVDTSVPTFTCQALTDAYGACRQLCPEGPLSATRCQGPGMGCVPEFVTGLDAFLNVCSPVGTGAAGDRCSPYAAYGGCAQGLYCDAQGNTAPGFDPVLRGQCATMCSTAQPDCPGDQSCRPLDYDGFEFGECATPCDPTEFADASCPMGQRACLPAASLTLGGDGTVPVTQDEQAFCSASGDIAIGQPCASNDCVAGAECLFPRSAQTGFVTSLLSQYVGAVGLQSTCVPQCNPFDGEGECAAGETCLFNFPYNADVGSCAKIEETVAPSQACTKPGFSCGEDSICVVDGAQNLCYRFCQYTGVAADGTYERSTCPATMRCNPLVADLGICLSL